MIRLIVRIDDAGMACNVGGSVLTTLKTFDIDHPALEAALKATGTYAHAQLVGAEILEAEGGR